MSQSSRAVVHVLLALIAQALCGCGGGKPAPDSSRPQRICSVNVAADEMLADLVAPSRVVAVTTYGDDAHTSNVVGHYPETIVRIAEAELEPIVALSPDLLVTSPYHSADFKEIAGRSGLRLCRLQEIRSGADVITEYRRLGAAVGEQKAAESVVSRLAARTKSLERRLSKVTRRPRVLYVSGSDMTAGRKTLIGEIIERAGGRNVGAELGIDGWGQFEAESVVVANPDVLLVSRWSGDRPRDYGSLRVLPAVTENRIVELPGRLLSTTSRHWIEAAETLAKVLHPSAFEDDGKDG